MKIFTIIQLVLHFDQECMYDLNFWCFGGYKDILYF